MEGGYVPCDAFELDMSAKQSGMCVCGFARVAHSRLFPEKESVERLAGKRPSLEPRHEPPQQLKLELKHEPPQQLKLSSGTAASSTQLYAANGNRACDHFVIDMGAIKAGMCTCGFARLAHVKMIPGSAPAVATSMNATGLLQARLRDLGFSPMSSDLGTAAARSVDSLPQPVRDALLYIMQFRESAEAIAKTAVVSASPPPVSPEAQRKYNEEDARRPKQSCQTPLIDQSCLLKEEEARKAAATARRLEDDARRAAEAKQKVDQEETERKLKATAGEAIKAKMLARLQATQLKHEEDAAAKLKEEEERKCKEDAASSAADAAQAACRLRLSAADAAKLKEEEEQERREEEASKVVEAEQKLKEEAARMRKEEMERREAAAEEAEHSDGSGGAQWGPRQARKPEMRTEKHSEDEARKAAGVKLFPMPQPPVGAPVAVAPATNKSPALAALFANATAPSLFADTSAGSQISGQKTQQNSTSPAPGGVKSVIKLKGSDGTRSSSASKAFKLKFRSNDSVVAPKVVEDTPKEVQQQQLEEAAGDASTRTYSLEQLKHHRLNDSLDDLVEKKGSLEDYLKEEEFLKTFGMPPVEFSKLPAWKRRDAKKKAGIF